jgi:hypothetical protein
MHAAEKILTVVFVIVIGINVGIVIGTYMRPEYMLGALVFFNAVKMTRRANKEMR